MYIHTETLNVMSVCVSVGACMSTYTECLGVVYVYVYIIIILILTTSTTIVQCLASRDFFCSRMLLTPPTLANHPTTPVSTQCDICSCFHSSLEMNNTAHMTLTPIYNSTAMSGHGNSTISHSPSHIYTYTLTEYFSGIYA